MKKMMIAAMSSGSGKTMITAGLLMALKKRNIDVRSFKCGPDYIDPMFHARVLGVPCRNLDLFLLGERGVLREVNGCDPDNQSASGDSCIVLEGAMGFYDGIGGTTEASAYEVAALCEIPVILAVRSRGQSATLAAQICGMMNFRKGNHIAGVVLNECSSGLYRHLKEIVERECGIPVFGYVPKMEEAKIESRHLGLLTAGEIPRFRERFAAIASQMEESVDIDRILEICEANPGETAALRPASAENRESAQMPKSSAISQPASAQMPTGNAIVDPAAYMPGSRKTVCRIAVARDEAFSFYYETSLDALRRAGAELVPFSPIRDAALPPGIGGLYLGGGYPENFAKELSANVSMRCDIRKAVGDGLPTVAECGGFMYLQQMLEGTDGEMYPMAGLLPGESKRREHLVRFGYVTLVPDEDSLLFRAGENVHAHEFHHWDSTAGGEGLLAQKRDGRTWRCGEVGPHLYAGFPHLELGGDVPLAGRFLSAAVSYAAELKNDGMSQ